MLTLLELIRLGIWYHIGLDKRVILLSIEVNSLFMKKYIYLLFLLTTCVVVYAQGDIVKSWEFDINGKDGIPCRFEQERNLLFMSGFSVTDNGVFYFAGGKPLSIACFKGSKKVYQREIDALPTKMSLFKTMNDSVYLVNDQNLTLYRMHKNGKGKVSKVKLDVNRFTPYEGAMQDSRFVVIQRIGPALNANYKAIYFGYSGRLIKKKDIENKDNVKCVSSKCKKILDRYLYPSMKLEFPDFVGDYKGTWNGYNIFWGGIYNSERACWTLAFADKEGKVMKHYDIIYHLDDMYDVVPLPVLTNDVDTETFYTAPTYCILHEQNLYMLGYSGAKKKIILCSINLLNAFNSTSSTK